MFKNFLVIAAVLYSACSHPAAEAADLPAKRTADERIFLVNCQSWNGINNPSTTQTWSEMDWYSTDAKSQTGLSPDAAAKVITSGHITWEGHQITGAFSDGNKFVSNIQSGAQNLANFKYAGYGSNNYHGFNCYKDDGRTLWGWEGGIGEGGASAGCQHLLLC
ncbi:hypothetical protein G7Y89_g12791 [Cudoniella acicularis]|uniref:Uncharacterized protein n=1 Tax=Cudoniella acicularis TaxID=354080 RepID=A0A8H4VX14_9HELO|nr:hypothetical protein G7Y89_g12791 [Cudoniella acicularis]